MYDMLNPGGQLFLSIIANTAVYDVYENMARMEKWSRFSANVKDYVSIYHHLNNPQKKLENFLEKAGFVIELCKTEDRYYTYRVCRTIGVSKDCEQFCYYVIIFRLGKICESVHSGFTTE